MSRIIGISDHADECRDFARCYGPRTIPVCIVGETGTGKRMMAEELHRLAGRPCEFMVIHASEISNPALLTSRLFGHEKGAFTGAVRRQRGLLETGGYAVVLLDDIQDLPLDCQSALLTALDGYGGRGVGLQNFCTHHIRFLISAQKPLDVLVREKRLKHDLKARMAGVTIHLKPLRERLDDLVALIPHLVEQAAARDNLRARPVSDSARLALQRQRWDDNVRGLGHVCWNGLIRADYVGSATIEPAHLILPDGKRSKPTIEMVLAALEASLGNVAEAARALDVHERTLWRLIATRRINIEGIRRKSVIRKLSHDTLPIVMPPDREIRLN